MPDADELFAAERPRLVGLAYRMLGSVLDAEDIVQEAWIRWDRTAPGEIERPAAWLTTVVSHLAVDRLRVRRREREDYVGPWLPEPLIEHAGPAAAPVAPEQHAELADSLSTAFLVLLESLSPTERLVVLLADVFGEPFATIAGIVGRSEEATRQLAVRARRKLRRDATAPPPEGRRADAEQQRLAEAFAAALVAGDQATLVKLVAPDVVLTSDGGPDVHAARRPVVGRDRVLRFLENQARRFPPEVTFHWVRVNGSPGTVVRLAGSAVLVLQFEVHAGAITAVRAIVNPRKLQVVERPVDLR